MVAIKFGSVFYDALLSSFLHNMQN